MKTKIAILAALALLTITATAQTNSADVLNAGEQSASAWWGTNSHSFLASSNIAITAYADYALDIKKDNIGGGILLTYHLSPLFGAGIGVDEMAGDFTMISGNVTFKLDTKPLAWTGWAPVTNWIATPILIASAGKPISGSANRTFSTVAGIGATTHLYKGVNIGALVATWDNTGNQDGKRIYLFATLRLK